MYRSVMSDTDGFSTLHFVCTRQNYTEWQERHKVSFCVNEALPVKMCDTWRDTARSDRRLKRTGTGRCRSLYSGSSVTVVAEGKTSKLLI